MQSNQKVTEISGKPGKVWGNVFVASTGKITVKITGDILQATLKSGLEKTDSWIRIQNIDSIEIAEAPEYVLIIIGIIFCLSGLGALKMSVFLSFILLALGIACIVHAFLNKRRLLAIHSLRSTIPVFMNKPSATYQQFAEHVIAIARQLNASPTISQANRTTSNRPPTPPTSGQRTGT